MKAWCFDRYGDPSVLQLKELPTPTSGPGEVVVKILASAVNPSDVKNVSGHFKTPLPRIPGRDYAGVVAAGAREKGEEVWGSGPGFGVTRDGAHCEYVVMPSTWLSKKPATLTMAQAASIGVPFLAAWWSLVEAAQIQSGETVLITGVAGAVGNAATQIAHLRGARVIGTDLIGENPSGADATIDARHANITDEVLKLTSGKGVELAFDTVGGPLFEPVLKSLARGGRQVAIASNPQVVSFNLVDFYHGQKRLIGVDTMALTGEQIASTMDELRPGFDEGKLARPNVRKWPFERAVEAYDAVANQKPPPEKHVLVIGD
jgi:NADPH:quinone reductase